LLGELVRAAGRRHEPPPGDYEHVLLAARTAWQRKVRARRRQRFVLALAAGLVIVLLAGATLFQWTLHRSPQFIASAALRHGDTRVLLPNEVEWQPLQVGLAMSAGTRVRTGFEGGAALELRNGTSIRLNHQSEITFESQSVLRLESGTMYADTRSRVPPDALRIDTPLGSIRDVGTVFEVKATYEAVRVRVREGRVRLEMTRAPSALEGHNGEEIEVGRNGEVTHRAFSSHDGEWSWAETLATTPDIEGRPLLQFLTWVAHETGRQLMFDEPATEAQARAVTLHGKAAKLPPLEALDILLSTTDLEYVLRGDQVILIRRRENP
jgi:ferric-dicitrate binding protein FerR (iron transport regulator)